MAAPSGMQAAAAQAGQLWALLDEMAESEPEAYRALVRRQLRAAAELGAPPEPRYCLRTRVLEPEERSLYINVCGWKRVPPPESPAHAVPVCGGRLEALSAGSERCYVLDVAFNPEVLRREQEEGCRAWLAQLAVNFAQQQHGLRVSQGYTIAETPLMGSVQGLRERLAPSRRPVAPDRVPTGPSLLQQISSLRSGADDPPVVLAPPEPAGPRAPPLIQVISSTEAAPGPEPRHELTLSEGPAPRVQLKVHLPGVRSVSQCQLSASQDDILLQVGELYRLHLELPAPVREEETTAVFNRKRQTLSVSLPLL